MNGLPELDARLDQLSMRHYFKRLVDEGFTSWAILKEATDEDMEVMGIASHHQKILRRMFRLEAEQDGRLGNPYDSRQLHQEDASNGRRKYKRHPKADTNGPARPLTAYVRFAKHRRREYQDADLSFADLAKRIGREWQSLDDEPKARYLDEASEEWKTYRRALAHYRTSPQHEEYMRYIEDFSRRNAMSNESDRAMMPDSPILPSPRDIRATGSHRTDFFSVPCSNQAAILDVEVSSSASKPHAATAEDVPRQLSGDFFASNDLVYGEWHDLAPKTPAFAVNVSALSLDGAADVIPAQTGGKNWFEKTSSYTAMPPTSSMALPSLGFSYDGGPTCVDPAMISQPREVESLTAECAVVMTDHEDGETR